MGRSLGLFLYWVVSQNGLWFARKQLAKRQAVGKEDPSRLNERLGQITHPRSDGKLIWFHAASVGESLSLLELIRRLGVLDKTLNFLVTTGTRTSAQLMTARLPERAVHQFIPVDILSAVNGFLDHWKPDLAVWTESEFWPSLMIQTDKRHIPMVLINARMSEKSYRKWRWAPHFAKNLLERFSHVLAQEDMTAKYLRNLGVPADKIEVSGTLKEGSSALPHDEAERVKFSNLLGGRPVWLAASTHKGEDELVAEAHRLASKTIQRLLLIIAPRHPERGDDVARIMRERGWAVKQRSSGELPDQDTEVYVADTLGELGLWFRVAPVSFIGGSLVEIGGHNPFEPAALGSAILHGPYVENFADIYFRLSQAEAAVEITNPVSLAEAVYEVMSPDKAASMAHAAWEVCSEGAEVTDKVMEILMAELHKTSGRA